MDFVARFNAEEFWESHEVLERPWREGRSDFYKGLILFASAYVHVQRENPRGVEAQMRKAERHLDRYRPAYLGLNVDELLRIATDAKNDAAAHNRGGKWRRPSFPKLHPEPARLRGDEVELRQG